MSFSSERIGRLAKSNDAKRYLEIGVCKGDTFHHVSIPRRTAVDPEFQFNVSDYSNLPDTWFIEKTSDDFFASLKEGEKPPYDKEGLYDIIFIDGLHTFEQTLRDFDNTLPYSHSRTIWILDDTVPDDPWSAMRDKTKSVRYRVLAGSRKYPWHGDVFKCVFALHDFYPNFSFATVYDRGNPQTVVWKTEEPSAREPIFGDMKTIAGLDYFDLLDNCHVLNPVKDEELLSMIGSRFSSSKADANKLLPLIVKNFS